MPVTFPTRRLAALALVAFVTAGAKPLAAPGPAWTLEQDDRTYTYTVTLSSTLPKAVLLDVLFDPGHVAAFSKSAGRLSVIREDAVQNEVRFDTRRLIFTCSTTFKRVLDRESGSIDIEMTSFKAGWGRLAPHARSSHARYVVSDNGTSREIVYRQDVETDKPVSGYSLRVLKKSLAEFAHDLDLYLRRPELGRDGGSTTAGAEAQGGGW